MLLSVAPSPVLLGDALTFPLGVLLGVLPLAAFFVALPMEGRSPTRFDRWLFLAASAGAGAAPMVDEWSPQLLSDGTLSVALAAVQNFLFSKLSPSLFRDRATPRPMLA